MDRREFVTRAGVVLAGTVSGHAGRLFAMLGATGDGAAISIDAGRTTGSLPHFWEKAAGSDRTVVGLREQWRQDLVRVQKETGIQSVRCHGLFDDEMGIAAAGAGNFSPGRAATIPLQLQPHLRARERRRKGEHQQGKDQAPDHAGPTEVEV